MGKQQDMRRKARLEERKKIESFRFQVLWEKKQRMPELPDEDALLNAEMNTLCENGLAIDMLALRDIVEGVRKKLGVEPEEDRGSLIGAIIPYLLGITKQKPTPRMDHSPIADMKEMPLQVRVFYDNEVRNEVVDWVRNRYETVTTRLGQPILKLSNMVVEFRRVVKE